MIQLGKAFRQMSGQLHALRRGLRKYLVLAKPAFGVSTREVFAGIDACEIPTHPDLAQLKRALRQRDDEIVYQNMINVLENYTLPHYPRVRALKDRIAATDGVRKVLMSGSGPTVFGIFDDEKKAKNAYTVLKAGTQARQVFLTKPVN